MDDLSAEGMGLSNFSRCTAEGCSVSGRRPKTTAQGKPPGKPPLTSVRGSLLDLVGLHSPGPGTPASLSTDRSHVHRLPSGAARLDGQEE